MKVDLQKIKYNGFTFKLESGDVVTISVYSTSWVYRFGIEINGRMIGYLSRNDDIMEIFKVLNSEKNKLFKHIAVLLSSVSTYITSSRLLYNYLFADGTVKDIVKSLYRSWIQREYEVSTLEITEVLNTLREMLRDKEVSRFLSHEDIKYIRKYISKFNNIINRRRILKLSKKLYANNYTDNRI